jgi:gluconate 2-dehydrogenase gamma chain
MTFFDDHQRATVEAAMARIIPTDHEPGAREAGCVDFVDRYLSGVEHVYALPDGSGFEVLEGRRAQAWRTRIDRIRQTYSDGLADLDRRSRLAHGTDFVQLTEEQQDQVIRDLERGVTDSGTDVRPNITYGGPVEPALQQTNSETDLTFLPLLVLHTRQGFYADPVYGGNRGHVGWQVIGFPGPASLAEVHDGSYSTLDWFADNREHPTTRTEV